ncbi:MAG: hypothetical protein NC253_14375 [Ruminococcus sp.]|nr:hypothetical protein [Ruminococcus sp.]MCM1382329.1 hypothetical protein [Muribaculaceae bacterium]MCM1480950.1 hypothetical protein [Muribaculaceae bacterium]
MKKLLTVILTLALALTCFAACSKDEDGSSAEGEETAYHGILTKVKLGMPLTKIISYNQEAGVDLNYESDTVVWSQNPDTELMEIRNIIPTESAYYYVDDSLITYSFETRKGDPEMYLTSYMSEVYCLLNKETAKNYYESKTAELAQKHGVEAVQSTRGTEDIDLEIEHISRYSCSSYDLTFIMTEKYDTVDGVDGYYGSYFSLEVKEKANKEEVSAGSTPAEE